MNHLLFSYGTLQIPRVQKANFGRFLNGKNAEVYCFKLYYLTIVDTEVLAISEQESHPIAVYTNDPNDCIRGMVFEITEEELMQADLYEVKAYKRVEVLLNTKERAWMYIKADSTYVI